MPNLKNAGFHSQDTIHILAKLRTRLVTPTNLIVICTETACRAHLEQLISSVSKANHGLTMKSINHEEKQNYDSINAMVSKSVESCLQSLSKLRPKGTLIYLSLMWNIREAFFNKALSPLERIYLMWKTVYFLRIWRSWLSESGYDLKEHFITENAYTCIELNSHMLLNVVFNVINNVFPPQALRVWLTGSQGCEQMFRLLRSMTPTFSTIINFTLRAMLERIHKINFLSSMESDDSLEFPRAKRRLLHLNKETEATFTVPTVDDITSSIKKAKHKAISICNSCCMELENYDDTILLNDKMSIIENALIFDNEVDNNEINNNEQDIAEEIVLPREEAIGIKEDMIRLTLIKSKATNLPTYEISNNSDQKGKKYSLTKNGKSAFLVYEGTIIRKTTALYILQENSQLSNNRLLRVRSEQASHLFDSTKFNYTPANCVRAGDLCLFKSVDNEEKCVLDRIIQFSYLCGNKREREYSSNYCDMTIESHNDIGAFAN